jgi:hypothetical protein
MTTGHVFKFDAENSMGLFVIFQVHSKPFALVRFLDATSAEGACEELGRTFAGKFKPALPGMIGMAQRHMKRQQSFTVLTN